MLTSLRARPVLHGVIRNSGWLVFDRLLRLGGGMLVSLLVARYLGPEQFGLLSSVFALVSLFGSAGNLGLPNIVLRDIVREKPARGEILGTSLVMRLIGGVVVFAVSVISLLILRPGGHIGIQIGLVVAAVSPFLAFETIDNVFQADLRAPLGVWARNATFLLVAITKVILVWRRAPLLAFAATDAASTIVVAGAMVIAYRVGGYDFSGWRPRMTRARALLRESWPQALSGIAIMVYMRIDQIMLQEIARPREPGLYSAATRISEVWYFVPIAILASSFPVIVSLRQAGQSVYYRRIQQLFDLMSAIAISIALPMTFLSNRITHLLYGGRYDGAGPVLAVHTWAALFVFWGVAQEPWNVAEGLTRLTMYRTVAGAVLNVLMNFFLIPRYGAMGAAVATVVAYGLAAWAANLFDRRTRVIFWLELRSLLFPVSILRQLRGSRA